MRRVGALAPDLEAVGAWFEGGQTDERVSRFSPIAIIQTPRIGQVLGSCDVPARSSEEAEQNGAVCRYGFGGRFEKGLGCFDFTVPYLSDTRACVEPEAPVPRFGDLRDRRNRWYS